MEIVDIDSKEIIKDCADLYVCVFNSEPWNDRWNMETAFERLTDFFDTPRFFGAAVWDNGKLIAAIIGNSERYFSGDYYNLKEMFVSPEYQRAGVGKKLLKYVKKRLAENKIDSIILFTSNEFYTVGFYKKNGFIVLGNMRMLRCGL
ncbi:MAG: GNAT family N-acetyltransferase [Spirochaetes bacterium]|nr:GNAT family N-acetyltransferase [Spirochaetota bacterium]MBN2771053.1 GNAT family N-acetyltransferase [Spirochaetota bacterium]